MKRWTVFLDRDGVLNRKAPPDDYIKSWQEFAWVPGAPEALRTLQQRGLRLIVVTNQQGIAKGLIKLDALDDIHRNMEADLARAGVVLDGIYVCPHLAGTCDCRKPETGMFRAAQRDHRGLSFEHSVVLGDSASDIEAGRRIGARTVYLRPSGGPLLDADAVVDDLGEAVQRILAWV
jgi:D-glycero-D-manno-heptose 1,7-bisphosphate phosphatase